MASLEPEERGWTLFLHLLFPHNVKVFAEQSSPCANLALWLVAGSKPVLPTLPLSSAEALRPRRTSSTAAFTSAT